MMNVITETAGEPDFVALLGRMLELTGRDISVQSIGDLLDDPELKDGLDHEDIKQIVEILGRLYATLRTAGYDDADILPDITSGQKFGIGRRGQLRRTGSRPAHTVHQHPHAEGLRHRHHL